MSLMHEFAGTVVSLQKTLNRVKRLMDEADGRDHTNVDGLRHDDYETLVLKLGDLIVDFGDVMLTAGVTTAYLVKHMTIRPLTALERHGLMTHYEECHADDMHSAMKRVDDAALFIQEHADFTGADRSLLEDLVISLAELKNKLMNYSLVTEKVCKALNI